MENFGTLNWAILISYLLINLLMGSVLSRKVQSAEDYYLGNRTTPWWAIGLSVMATYVSAMSFLGGPAWSYGSGMGVMMIQINYPLVVFLVITLFLPFFYNSGVVSIYDYQERRFGKKARAVMSIIFMMTQTLSSAAVLYATALVLSFITQVDVTYAILAISLIALVYTMMGGITAVIWTDVLQAAVLLVGAVIIFYALIDRMPDSLGVSLEALQAEGKMNIMDWSFDLGVSATVWSGVIAMTLYHVTVYGANQMVVQRALAAKNIGDAKKSFMFMGFAAFFIYFLFLLMGVLFYHYYQGREFENGNTIVLEFAAEYGMPGLLGIVAAAVVAASMSSLDSALNSLATVTTVDFYEKYFKKGASSQHYLKASRLFTVIWAVLIVAPAILFAENEGSVLELLTKAGSYFVGAQLSMYGLGFFSKHTTERGLLVGVAAGFVAVWLVATLTGISWPWFCAIGAGVNILVSIVASLLIDGRQTEYSTYTVKGQKAMFREQGLPTEEDGWSLLPGKVDNISWLLVVFFVITMLALYLLTVGI
ncbi:MULTISPECIES: sodium:solute symporter family transporter [unclassified Cobetia]|uniref:sodium:solute symporter family transporter n=1 Tax=unclassified Cobetia TaxID=2609414 RepID=UPI00178CF2A0|nr:MULTISPECIES: sodium/solute symporter [unclassified Cobetia]MBE2170262.1 sodium/solute symporter [Cobetia sp. 2AS1]MDH2446976.1 sodium/solute symporter [Cobetia sp. 2AS]